MNMNILLRLLLMIIFRNILLKKLIFQNKNINYKLIIVDKFSGHKVTMGKTAGTVYNPYYKVYDENYNEQTKFYFMKYSDNSLFYFSEK